MINWSLLTGNKSDTSTVKAFAKGSLSGQEFYTKYKYTEAGGLVRNLIRENGVYNARQLAKRALRRRGVSL